ncbi:hypothetical protein NX722_28640 [Endozoicomonas gorgoniicola]|uniref:Uncharacterized protein n=1 Tax=Endozoicomonas gorgoniicola TaxID=1234144 RepID=A0ABT3N496_9GAMM|nr:hypothetical protein [Endozoicomonas gorgoniicola]MCW7556443.1 hypothetical protein [Endozoicomonas gorgoniicola]MCW7556536.1 hypothetical protein [Endozoicomonas gorgoniicola]
MNDLVFIKGNKLRTNSLLLAKHFGIEHASVVQSIEKGAEDGRIQGNDIELTCLFDQGKRQTAIELSERALILVAAQLAIHRPQRIYLSVIDQIMKARTRL